MQNNRDWQCPKCKVKFIDVTDECPVCYYRTMAARYGAQMSDYFKTLKLIADLNDAARMKEIARAGMDSKIYFNFVEIYSDCLLVLIETGSFFERAVNFEMPDELIPEIAKINQFIKELVIKYQNAQTEYNTCCINLE